MKLIDKHQRFLRFLVVGGVNTVFGYSVFALLYLAGLAPQLAIVIATVIGVNFNFLTTGRLVFGNRTWRKLLPFWFGYGVALAVNLFLAELLLRSGVNALLTQALCMPIYVVTAYYVNAHFVFSRAQDNN